MDLCLTGFSHFQIRFESFIRPSSFPAHKLSLEWESQGVWDREPTSSLGRKICISEEVPDLHITGWSFFFREKKANLVTSALQQFLLVTASGLQWWRADEHTRWTKQHCAFLACHPLCANTAYTGPVLMRMWDNLSWTGKKKHTCAGLCLG